MGLIVFGLGIGGFTSRWVGVALIVVGALWFLWAHYWPSKATSSDDSPPPDNAARAEREIVLARRAILIGEKMQAEYERHMGPYRIKRQMNDANAEQYYGGAVNLLKLGIGEEWDGVLDELAAAGLLDRSRFVRSEHWANMTGFDQDGAEVAQIGRDLLKRVSGGG